MDELPEVGLSVDVAGLRTNYHDEGSGPPVLLLHGSGPGVSAWSNWRTVIPALSQTHRVIAPDAPGFGFTDQPVDGVYSIERWTTHLEAFLDRLDLERVNVVGNSFGGALALHLAVRAPHRVQRLVLMGSAGIHFPLTAGLDAVWGYTPSVEAMDHLLDVFVHDRSILPPDLAERRYQASTRPGVQEAYAAMFPPPRQTGIDRLALADETAARITAPALLVHGRDDQVIPLDSSLRLLSLLPQAQLHVFGACGHWTQIERGSAFCDLVTRFLAGGLDTPVAEGREHADASR